MAINATKVTVRSVIKHIVKATITNIRGMEDGADRILPQMLWGPYGVAKSSAVRAAADLLAEEFGSFKLIDTRESQLASTDFTGMPQVANDMTRFAVPEWLPTEERDGKYGMWFLDEVQLASASVEHVTYQLLNDGRIGNYELPKGWVVIAASNRPQDGAGVHGRRDAAQMNRFSQHFDVHQPTAHWVEDYASPAGLDASIIAFLMFRGEGVGGQNGCMHEFPDGGAPKDRVAIATHRSWTQASRFFDYGYNAEEEAEAFESCLGAGVAAEFMGFLRTMRNLPNVMDYLDDPDQPTPEELSTQFALTSILSQRCDPSNLSNALKVVRAMNEELVPVFWAATGSRKDVDIIKGTAEYVDYKVNEDIH